MCRRNLVLDIEFASAVKWLHYFAIIKLELINHFAANFHSTKKATTKRIQKLSFSTILIFNRLILSTRIDEVNHFFGISVIQSNFYGWKMFHIANDETNIKSANSFKFNNENGESNSSPKGLFNFSPLLTKISSLCEHLFIC